MSKNCNEFLQLNNSSLEEIKNIINNLPAAGGSNASDAIATADEIFAGETAYNKWIKQVKGML